MSTLNETIEAIRPLDAAAMAAAKEHDSRLTKPPGSLGTLEDVVVQLAGLAGADPAPLPEPAAVVIFAADHGVHAQRVTPWPQEVTGQMVANFLAGGAVVNAFAKQAGVPVTVVDIGVAQPLPAHPALLDAKVAAGTADLSVTDAMSSRQAIQAIEAGINIAAEKVAAGNRLLIAGDMGIANTTASAALIAAFTGCTADEATGRGTGIDDATWDRKRDIVAGAVSRLADHDPLTVLAAVGGLEHAAIAGFILGAAARRTPVILDGVIGGAAALVAQGLCPDATTCMVAGHRSAEPGHAMALSKLGLTPLLDLNMRLGEGTGALLALPIVRAAVRVMHDVATFDSAGVSESKQ